MSNEKDVATYYQAELALTQTNGIVTWEQYQHNAEQLARAREALSALEAQNQAGYERFLAVELQNRIEAGRRAERQLALLRAQQGVELRAATMSRSLPGADQVNIQTPRAFQSQANLSYGGANIAELPQSPLVASQVYQNPSHASTSVPPQPYHSTSSSAPTQPSHSTQQYQYYRPHVHDGISRRNHGVMDGTMRNASQAAQPDLSYVATPHAAASTLYPASSSVAPQWSGQVPDRVSKSPAPTPEGQVRPWPGQPPFAVQTPAQTLHQSQAIPVEAGTTRVEHIRSSQAASSTSSTLAESSFVLEAIAKGVYGLMKGLKPEIIASINRLVIEKLRHKIDPSGKLHLGADSLKNQEDIQAVTLVGNRIIEKVQNLQPRNITGILRHVNAKLLQNRPAPIPPSSESSFAHRPVIPIAPSTSVAPENIPAPQTIPEHHHISHFPHETTAIQSSGAASPETPKPHMAREPDTSTLARDILRSLGKSRRSQEPSEDTRKRKRDESTPTPDKKPRMTEIPPGIPVPVASSVAGAPLPKDRALSSIPISVGDTVQTTGAGWTASQESVFPVDQSEVVFQTELPAQQTIPPAPVSEPVPETELPMQQTPTPAPVASQPEPVPEVEPPAPDSSVHATVPEYVEEIITPGAMQMETENRIGENVRSVNEVLQTFSNAPVPEVPSRATSPPATASSIRSSQNDSAAHIETTTILPSAPQEATAPVEPSSIGPNVIDLTMSADSDVMHAQGVQALPTESLELPHEPVASSSKMPLFYPESPSENESPGRTYGADADGDTEMEDFVPTGLLGIQRPKEDKGKQKATEDVEMENVSPEPHPASLKRKRQIVDSDVEIVETSDVEEARIVAERGKPFHERRLNLPRVYVLVPPLPPDAARFHTREARKMEEEDGRKAVTLSRPRLSEHHCCWRGCDAVLDSAEKLSLHVQLHAGENSEWNSFTCQWDNCPEFYSNKRKLAAHLKRHSYTTLICAYIGCIQSYSTPKDLARHHILEHEGDALKPTATLITPQLPVLPPLPEELPSYMTVPRRIMKTPISHDTHIWLGAKVAANITCYVHPGSRANAAKPSRLAHHVAACVDTIAREALEKGLDPRQAVLRMARDEYDDWIEYGSKGPKFCDDLDSAEVTHMVDEGLVLGGTEESLPVPAGQVLKLEAPGPQVLEDGTGPDSAPDGVNDDSHMGVQEPQGHSDDSSFGDLELNSSASAGEVAEIARLLVDGQGTFPDLGQDTLAARAGADHSLRVNDPDVEEAQGSTSDPGWTILPARPDDAT